MLLKDFETGGFPISRRSPVICTIIDGQVKVAYNRYELYHTILKFHTTTRKMISCVGMWPGKKNTDCFRLNPDCYTDAPPEQHKEIDNATEIRIYTDPNGTFMKVEYDLDGVTIEAKEEKLALYVKNVRLKFKNFFAKV